MRMTKNKFTLKKGVKLLIHSIAFGFGSGFLPGMPGTFGTLAAVPFYLLMRSLSLGHYIILVLGLTIVAIIVSDITSRDLGVHDAPSIVIDEMVGFWWTMTFVPSTVVFILLGFISFRCFDIVKPWPIRWIDQYIKGGLGIVLDDLIAAVFAMLTLNGLAYIVF